MADSKDPRLDDETRLQEFRRLAAEIAADAPTLARIAIDRKSTRLNSSHMSESRMPSSA